MLSAEALLHYLQPQGFEYDSETGLPQLPHKVLFCFSPWLADQLRREFGGLSHRFLGARLDHLQGTERGWGVLSGFGLGAPAAVAKLEELRACGVRDMLFMGTAGALVPELKPGRLGLCLGAYCDEGTSAHYEGPSQGELVLPHPEWTQEWASQLARQSLDFVEVRSWTTDAPYRETPQKIQHFVAQGAHCVEMEASALFVAAQFHQLRLAGLVVISDELHSGQWRPHLRDPKVKAQLLEAARFIIRTGC